MRDDLKPTHFIDAFNIDAVNTQDGPTFTSDRHRMTDVTLIAERMSRDMATQVRSRGFWDLAQLEADGWASAQVEEHWRAAMAVFRAKSARTKPELPERDRATVSLGAEIIDASANIIALAIFIGSIFLIGGVL